MIRQRLHRPTGARIVHEQDGGEGRVRAFHRGKQVGELVYHVNESYFPEKTLYPDQLDVDQSHRGRGLATAMHGAALKDRPGLSMTHTVDGMSPDARRVLGRLQTEQPGRHKVFDESKRSYL